MKPLPIFMSIILILFVLAVIFPQVIRIITLKTEILPVSVTAIGSAVDALHAPSAPESDLPLINSGLPGIPGYNGLTDFAASLINGQADLLVGVYVPGEFSLPVRQQPSGQADYVARDNNVITQFGLPNKYGTTGLLAHNFLSGSNFFQLKPNNDIVLIYGDGRLEHYRVSAIEAFQALKPNSPFSDFVNLNDTSRLVMSSADLFNQIYTTRHRLVFQTCIDADGDPSWGRIFIIASLAEPLQLRMPLRPVTSLN